MAAAHTCSLEPSRLSLALLLALAPLACADDGAQTEGGDSVGTESGGTESGGTESGGTETGGTETTGTETTGTGTTGTESGGTETAGTETGDGDTGGTDTGGSGETGCLPGSEGCACDQGACEPGLACVDELCEPEGMSACGDGVLDPGEGCDDGNQVAGDGCEPDCSLTPGAVAVAVGYDHSCALDHGGLVHCWGYNDYGQLGKPELNGEHIGDDELPSSVEAVVLSGPATALVAGLHHTCAMLEGGELQCWGFGPNGALGYGSTEHVGDNEDPAAVGVVDLPEPVVELVAGAQTCARFESGDVRCWGSPTFGKLGYGNTETLGDDELVPQIPPVDLGGVPAVRIAASGTHTCALLEGGALYCWGRNNRGQLGYGHLEDIGDDELPIDSGPVELGAPIADLALAWEHSCVLTEAGGVRCWGRGDVLGYASGEDIGDDELPNMIGDVELGPGTVIGLDGGDAHMCARFEGGSLRCWGANGVGQLGLANTEALGDDELPSSVGPIELGGAVLQLSAYRRHICAIIEGDGLRCWGTNFVGQLGYGHTENVGDDETPASAGDVPFLP